jgi:RNA recognition motif-containing protein
MIIRSSAGRHRPIAKRRTIAPKDEQAGPDWSILAADSYSFGLSALGPSASQAPIPAKVSHPRKARREPSGRSFPAYLILSVRFIALTKLYVGNLPFTATEDGVRTLFSTHGTVEKVSLINDRDTGQPRGFGFVEMSSSDASRAMQALNGKDFDGRSLKVNEAQDKGGGGGGRGGAPRRF